MISTADILKTLADERASAITIRNALNAIIGEFGGLTVFAKNVVADYEAADPGHANRVRLTTALLNALGVYGGDDSEDGDDVETLEAMLQETVKGPDGTE